MPSPAPRRARGCRAGRGRVRSSDRCRASTISRDPPCSTISSEGPGAPTPAALGGKTLDPGRRRVVLAVDEVAREQAVQRPGDRRERLRHPQREALGHADRAVAVHDEPGKAVGLAPAESVRVFDETRRAAVLEGRRQPPEEERLVDGLARPCEDAAGQRRAGIVEAAAEESPGGIHHVDGFGRRPAADQIGDLGSVDPKVTGPEPPVHAVSEDDPGQRANPARYRRSPVFRRTTTMRRGCLAPSSLRWGLKP